MALPYAFLNRLSNFLAACVKSPESSTDTVLRRVAARTLSLRFVRRVFAQALKAAG